MTEPYTPTEDDLAQGKIHLGDNYWRELTEDEVRRAIARIKAEAWDEGAAYVNAPFGIEPGIRNPYRGETT